MATHLTLDDRVKQISGINDQAKRAHSALNFLENKFEQLSVTQKNS